MIRLWTKSAFVFYGLTILMVFASVFSLIGALSWLNKPFPGFLLNAYPIIGSMGDNRWTGTKAGLKALDRIVSIEGRPVYKGGHVLRAVRAMEPGALVHYQVERKGQLHRLDVAVARFAVNDFVLVFLIPFLGGLATYALGVIVYVLKPRSSTSWIFLILCFCLGTYMVTGFEMQSTHHLVHFHYLIIPLFPAAFFHLGLVFPDRRDIVGRFPVLQFLIYVPALLLVLAYQFFLFRFAAAGPSISVRFPSYVEIATVNRIFTLFCVASLVSFVIYSTIKASTATARQRGRMILFGVTIGFLPAGVLALLAFFSKIHFPLNLLVFFVIFFPASIAYSIVRHNLFDADTIIRRTVGYAVVTAVVVAAYLLLSLGFNVLLSGYGVTQSKVFPILFTIFIILIFNPLRDRIQSVVDRLFFRKDYDYAKIVEQIGGAITSSLDLQQILKRLTGTVTREMFVGTTSVMLAGAGGAAYRTFLADGEEKENVGNLSLRSEEPLVRVMEREKREVTRYDVLEDPKYDAIRRDCLNSFDTLHATLIIPLVFQDSVIGLMNLGEKKSGKSYTQADIELLNTLAKEGAVAITNARLAEQMKNEEKVRLNLARYLSPQIVDRIIKKDVQVNLGGDRKVVTAVFSDIRNFTHISENLPPDRLVSLLNEYFTEMAEVIFRNHGSLDKYIGDAIFAVFGSLIELENSAVSAVQAAIEMMKRMDTLNERWKKDYGLAMHMGIGINTGEVFLGNVGSPERMEFTVLGDTVNVASRFSGLARERQILISLETMRELDSRVECTELPAVQVKGKVARLRIYEVLY